MFRLCFVDKKVMLTIKISICQEDWNKHNMSKVIMLYRYTTCFLTHRVLGHTLTI